MTVITPRDIIAAPEQWALFLDIDGTLIDLAPDPEKVLIPADLPPLLGTLEAKFAGAVALNTGRQLDVVDHMMKPSLFAAAGVHGTELRTSRTGATERLAPTLPKALLTEVSAAVLILDPDIKVEDKGVGLAVHYRHAPHQAERLRHTLSHIALSWPAFELRPGRKVLELVPRGLSKATAIMHFLSHPPFRGRRAIVIGDDVGDEPALAYARANGGMAMTVAGERFPLGEATFAEPASVRAWLTELTEQVPVRVRHEPHHAKAR